MEPHTDTAAVDAPPTPEESLPSADATESLGFAEAIDKALADAQNPPEPEAEAPPEDPKKEESAEPVAEDTATEATDTKEETATDADLLESLTEDIGDDWTPKAANRFKQLKSELKDNRTEVEKLRQTVTEQESKMKEMSGLADSEDIPALKERLAEFEQNKLLTDLESTSAYKDAVSSPIEKLLGQANEISVKYDIDPDLMIDALTEESTEKQDQLLGGLLGDATDRDKARVFRIIEDLGPIITRRDELIENADAALKEAQLLEEQKKNADIAKVAEHRTNVTRNVAKRVTEKLSFLSGIEGLDMKSVEEKAATTDPAVVHPVDFAFNSIAAQILPAIVREYIGIRKEADALTDKLATFEGAEPTVGGSPAVDGSNPAGQGLSFAEAIAARLG